MGSPSSSIWQQKTEVWFPELMLGSLQLQKIAASEDLKFSQAHKSHLYTHTDKHKHTQKSLKVFAY